MKKIILVVFSLICSLFFFSCSDNEPDVMEDLDPLPIYFSALYNIFGDQGIGAAIWLGEDVSILFNHDGVQYVWIENGEIMDRKNVGDEASLFRDTPFTTITAGVSLNGSVFYFANGGKSYSAMSYDVNKIKGQWTNSDFFDVQNTSFLLTQWGDDGSCPFDAVRSIIGFHPDRNCVEGINFGEKGTMFDYSDTRYVTYDYKNISFEGAIRTSAYSIYNCPTGEKLGLDINTLIDAACIYVVNGKPYEMFFFNNGENFIYSEVGTFEISEPFDIIKL